MVNSAELCVLRNSVSRTSVETEFRKNGIPQNGIQRNGIPRAQNSVKNSAEFCVPRNSEETEFRDKLRRNSAGHPTPDTFLTGNNEFVTEPSPFTEIGRCLHFTYLMLQKICFEKDVILLNIFYFVYRPHLQCFEHIGLIYKIEPLLHFTNRVLFAPTCYAKLFSSDERLI